MSTKHYVVEGMTCEHCVKAVTEEVNEVFGTQGVDIDLEKGIMYVSGEQFSDEAIKDAVEAAGYKVVDADNAETTQGDASLDSNGLQ